jgi:xanthine/CO dehydrogenase XdhC/CoxF family maturation factor
MKELAAILQARQRSDAQSAVLATIVKTVGSSYRRAGARMLIFANGDMIGSISGGCLEQDVIAHSEQVRASGKAMLLSYDTTPEEDILFGVGLGCKGVIEIWLEPLEAAAETLDFCEHIFASGENGVVATVFRGESAGQRWFSANEAEARSSAARRHDSGAEIFFDVVQPPVNLFIFGAGYDAIPLARLASDLGYRVTVVDRRPAYATRDRFPFADAIILKAPSDISELGINKRSAAIVMSHHYVSDRDCLQALLPLPLAYLGLMGPRRRAETMLQEIRADGLIVGDESLRKLHNPVGLDIGAEGPDEIALAILAEINAVLAGHGGGMLREKKGPIHSARTELP